MEFRHQDIAQLVLGYLKEERCTTAFHEFLKSSEYLQEHALNFAKGHYLIFRVAGLRLIDYLHEYAAICTIVQERLEVSEYFKEDRPRSTLTQQILYLLDGDTHSRASTPINQDRNINRYFCPENTTNCTKDSNRKIQHVPPATNPAVDVISTVTIPPSNKLQNSSSRDSSLLNKSKDKCKCVISTVDKCTSTEEETDGDEKSHENCEEIFTHTFLENMELVEKLVTNINKEVSSKSSVELDNTAIESIVQMTETDPILVQLLEELIGPTTEANEESSSEKHSAVATPKNTTQPALTDTSIKQRLRNSKSQQNLSTDVLIEDQKEDAVECVLADKTELVLPTDQCYNINQPSYPTTSNQNPIYTNTGSLLMLQPNPNTNVPTKSLSLDSTKPCYIIGSQPFVNIGVSQSPMKITNVLSEQDILTMPTIIMCENNQQYGNSQAMIMSTPVSANLGQPCYQNLPLKGTPQKVQSLSEYITLYKCNESSPANISSQKPKLHEKQLIADQKNTTKKVLQTVSEITQSLQGFDNAAIGTADISEKVNKSQTDDTVTLPSKTLVDNQLETPQSKIIEKKEKSSSKNSSLVRQLNFSTPDKWVSRVPHTKSSSDKLVAANEPSTKSKKVNGSKSVRTILFKASVGEDAENKKEYSEIQTDSDSNKVCKSPKPIKKLEPSWDASLRVFQVPKSPTRIDRHKRKRLEDSVQQISNSKKPKENHNSTEEDVLSEVTLTDEEIINTKSENTKVTESRKKTKISQKRSEKLPTSKTSSSEMKTKKKSKTSDESIDKGPGDNVVSDSENITQNLKNDRITVDKQYEGLNRQVQSRINKKCNMENVKKLPTCDEVVLINVPKIKSCEVLEEGKNTLILSPSKLNANKRTLVDMEKHNVTQPTVILKCTNMDFRNSKTPESKPKDGPEEEVMKAQMECMDPPQKINELPILQTPIKYDLLGIPKTPGLSVSSSIDTPFTKAVIDQLSGVDINSIPTPKFPITPHFALTPACTNSPFSNRGTDYSTSSSYYQPSDTEQNKSLEQLIQECQKLEKQEIFSKEKANSDNCAESVVKEKVGNDNVSLVPDVLVENIEVRDVDEISNSKEQSEDSCISKILVEKQKAFNQSILGKKNMQLAKILSDAAVDENNSSSDSSSSKTDSSSSSSDSDSESSSCSCDVSPKKENSRDPYSLRPRKNVTPINRVTSTDCDTSIKKDESSIRDKETEKLKHPDVVLKKMEEIRQRTIAKFKNSNLNVKPKTATSMAKSISKLRSKPSSVQTVSKGRVRKTSHKSNPNQTIKETKKPTPNKNSIETCPNEKPSSFVKGPSNKSGTQIFDEALVKTPNSEVSKDIEEQKATLQDCTAFTLSINNEQTKDKADCITSLENVKSNVVKTINKLSIDENKIDSLSKHSTTIVEEEEDIVLHLSSDDENLEPFEMVETQLLCSNSSTPTVELSIAQDNKESNSTSNEKDISDKIVDTEAESLVKGLKQWGIHLVPNKTSIKVTPSSERKGNHSIKENKTVDDTPTIAEDKDTSLEEGEIITPPKKSKINPHSRKKSSNSKHDKKDESVLKKGKGSTISKGLFQEKSRHSSKSSHNSSKSSIQSTIHKASAVDSLQGKNDIKEPNFDIQFDTKTYEGETLHVRHNYDSRPSRKMTDYNLDILTKKISANVYIDELDSEVEKLLTFTRFELLLDIPSKSTHQSMHKKTEPKERSSEVEHSHTKRKPKPLQILANQLLGERVETHTSPLENLYTSDMVGKGYKTYNRSSQTATMRNARVETSDKSYKTKKCSNAETNLDKERPITERVNLSNSLENRCSETKLIGSETNYSKKEYRDNADIVEPIKDVNTAVNNEDDLMNYALIGSERVTEDEDMLTLDKRKRQTSEAGDTQNHEEKKKKTEVCQELLRNIDVDSFLKQLHGDM